MSVEATNWAWKQPVPNSSAKFVLLAMANRANPDQRGRVVAFCSIAYLAEATAQDRKTVVTNLAKLREWNLIEDTGERVGKTKQVPVYELKCPPDLFTEYTQKRNGSKTGTVPKKAAKSTVFPAKQAQKRDTDSAFDSASDSSTRARALGSSSREQQKPGEVSGRQPPAAEVIAKHRARNPATPEVARQHMAHIARDLLGSGGQA